MRFRRQFVAALAGLFACTTMTLADSVGPPPIGPIGAIDLGSYTTCVSTGCNCSCDDLPFVLAHADEVELEVLGETITASTGFGPGQSITVMVAPGDCASICYTFRVVKLCGYFFDTYETRLSSVSVELSSANCAVSLGSGPGSAAVVPPPTEGLRGLRGVRRSGLPVRPLRPLRPAVAAARSSAEVR